MSGASEIYDLVVVGGGMGGLATVALAQSLGLKTALLEAHTKLGGCAGYFSRQPYTFDAGATALMGLEPDEPIGGLLSHLGVAFESVITPCYRVHLPDRMLDIVPDRERFERNVVDSMADGSPSLSRRQRSFWRLQEWVGNALFRAAGEVPRLPIRSIPDAVHDIRVLGFSGAVAASASLLTVEQVLRLMDLNRHVPFRSLVAMLLQDTAQAGPETVPFANASACLQAYRLGMSRPRGGMRALVEGIGERFAAMGGDLRTATLVDLIETEPTSDRGQREFLVKTRRRHAFRARQVALNLPLDLAARLLGRSLEGRLASSERKSRAAWSAFTGYVAIDRRSVPDAIPLFHHVLRDYTQPIHDGNNVLISLSAVDDEGYGPPDVRVATMSTHTRPDRWTTRDRDAYLAKKRDYRERLLAALDVALPGARGSLRHEEFASPRSFARYTRRTGGAVGGPPTSRKNSNLMAVGSDVFGPGIWIVGDSVFPGQGTMATVLSAIRVVERITGMPWRRISTSPRPSPTRSLAEIL